VTRAAKKARHYIYFHFSLFSNPQKDSAPRQRPLVTRKSHTSFIIVVTLLTLITIDIAAYAYIACLFFTKADTGDLEFKSSYVGLRELYQFGGLTPGHYDRILNMPRTAVQVYVDEPDRFSPPGAHQWLSDFGTLAPPDRHLQVSSKVSVASLMLV
jgi:hypothetical protein